MDWLINLLPFSYTDSVVFIGAVILGVAAGVLGAFAVLRQRSLVGDALSHATLPGVCVAFIATGAKDASTLAVGAAVAGFIGAAMILAIERTGRIRPDAAIGVVLTSFFSLGIVLLTFLANFNNANQAGLDRYLFGQAAGLLESDLVAMGSLCAVSLLLVALAFRPLKTALFDMSFAGSVGLPVRLIELAMTAMLVIAIVIGVRTVGAILMVAMLVVPTVTARQLTSRLSLLLVIAGIVGAMVGSTGALISASATLPTGPTIVIVGFCVALMAILLAPRRGVLWRSGKLLRDRRRALNEGVLIDLETALHAGAPPTTEELATLSGRPASQVKKGLRDLDRAGALRTEQGRIHLTESGAGMVHALLHQRSLWSAWLEYGWTLDIPDAREPDPRDLKSSLGDDLTNTLLQRAREGGWTAS
ncbi:MAG: manganese/zinc/iron transport system permease protein [Actinomycetota bacterium]|nr:manganese/zinc/iron transport system permease protein [Actinomycetota bacterium]